MEFGCRHVGQGQGGARLYTLGEFGGRFSENLPLMNNLIKPTFNLNAETWNIKCNSFDLASHWGKRIVEPLIRLEAQFIQHDLMTTYIDFNL